MVTDVQKGKYSAWTCKDNSGRDAIATLSNVHTLQNGVIINLVSGQIFIIPFMQYRRVMSDRSYTFVDLAVAGVFYTLVSPSVYDGRPLPLPEAIIVVYGQT